jgi:hypothetical protein
LQEKREWNRSLVEYRQVRFQNKSLEKNLFIKLSSTSPPPQDSTALLHEFNQVKEEYRENIIFCSNIRSNSKTPECVIKWRKLLLKLLDASPVSEEDVVAGTGKKLS